MCLARLGTLFDLRDNCSFIAVIWGKHFPVLINTGRILYERSHNANCQQPITMNNILLTNVTLQNPLYVLLLESSFNQELIVTID